MLLIKRNRDLILVISAFLGTTPLQNPVHAGEKTIIAHRGASGYVPEHTLEAVAMAHAFGADDGEPGFDQTTGQALFDERRSATAGPKARAIDPRPVV